MYKGIIAFLVFIFVLAIAIGQCSGSDDDYLAETEQEIEYLDNNSNTEDTSVPVITENNTHSTNKKRLDLKPDNDSNNDDINDQSKEDTTVPPAEQKEITIDIPRLVDALPSQILRREGYTVSYNNITKCSNWVSWHLTRDHTSGEWSRKGLPYFEDFETVQPRQEIQDWKYNPEHYDHGHMCPAADNKWSQKAMEQSFLLTNICPQDKNLNAGDWQELESKCRDWAYYYNDLYIVCGPLFYNGKNKTIGGQKEIWVPDAFFKVVLCTNHSPKAIGFIYPNEGKHHPMSYYVCTVDYVEEQTGIDFYYSLPDNIETIVESNANLNEWR